MPSLRGLLRDAGYEPLKPLWHQGGIWGDLSSRSLPPEGTYQAHAVLEELVWSRPRWFKERMTRVDFEIPNGIPHAGKGENSWDCGDDATFGMSTGECKSIPEGIGKLVGSCLQTRIRYGGWGDYEWKREAAE